MDFHMAEEIAQQPEMLRSRVAGWQRQCSEALDIIGSRRHRALLGRGSSGHAKVFYAYLHGLRFGRQALEFRTWLSTQPTEMDTDWSDSAALAFSVSGESADVVHGARWLREHGAYVLGVTNQAGSESALGRVSDRLLCFDAGIERAVPATKTFTAQLFVAAGLCGLPIEEAAHETAGAIESLLQSDIPFQVTEFVEGARAVLWVARGPALAGAMDAALKLQETAGVLSLGYSTAEILHQPIGALSESDRVLLFLDSDGPLESAEAVIVALVARGTPFLILTSPEGAAKRPDALALRLPASRWARTPVFAVVAQKAAFELACRGDRNPDRPPGLQKVRDTT
ncbi:MAG: SIS domain-containing protein [Acidobacteriota bacterium]|jgi:glucosamine--fructose-6-phosphate aminotransferase (isomerizing)